MEKNSKNLLKNNFIIGVNKYKNKSTDWKTALEPISVIPCYFGILDKIHNILMIMPITYPNPFYTFRAGTKSEKNPTSKK